MSDTPTPDAQAPDPRPRPQYGEYAPPGYVPPNFAPVEPEPALASTPSVPAPPRGLPADAAVGAAPDGTRRTPAWDRGLTIGLLVVGLFGALIGWLIGSDLTRALPLALEQYGIDPGQMPSWLDAAGTALVASHLLLYLLAVGLSIAMLRAGRPAFWAPLGTGVIAAIIFWSVMTAAVGPYAAQLQP